MKSSIKLRRSDGTYLKEEKERDFKTDSIHEKKNNFNFDFLEGKEKEISLNGIKIFFGDLFFDSLIEIETKHDFPFLSIAFEIEGGASYTPKQKGSVPFAIHSGEYNFYYMPKIDGKMTINQGKRKYFTILFTEEYIKQLFSNNFYTASTKFGKALDEKTPFLMFDKSKPIPFKLHEIITDIVNCCYDTTIKEVYIQSKIAEIFSYLFSEIKKQNTVGEKEKLRTYDKMLVKKAEKIINDNLNNLLTIDELAKLTGSNKFKLKKDFKLMYNDSIFSYASTLRMDKAKQMLLENKLTVTEIAYAVGYKNPQHFTAAFKKKFNYLPSAIRK